MQIKANNQNQLNYVGALNVQVVLRAALCHVVGTVNNAEESNSFARHMTQKINQGNVIFCCTIPGDGATCFWLVFQDFFLLCHCLLS